jgi:hypothetical protein
MPSIVGTWKLLHATARDAAGAARPSPYGGKALGRVTFTADGRMMSVVCDGRKELPPGISREYSSYCGNYTYDGEKLVTWVDAASDPSRIGSDQVRGVRFEGERMILIPPPRRRERGTPRDHVGADCGGVEIATSIASAWLRHVTSDAAHHALFASAQLYHVAVWVAHEH